VTDDLDLRILTPGLSEEEIAAVTSVVTAMVAEQRTQAEQSTAPVPRWRRSIGRLVEPPIAGRPWRTSLR